MTHLHKLSDCTDMTEEAFQKCFERVDVKRFIENPTQALIEAGVILKKGISFKFVETEEAANALPPNVFPLVPFPSNKEALSMDKLDKVAGGVIPEGFKIPDGYHFNDQGILGSDQYTKGKGWKFYPMWTPNGYITNK